MKHTSKNKKLMDAIGFALNWPTDYELVRYDLYKKVYRVAYIEGGGFYTIDLDESFVNSCKAYAGQKAWTAELAEPTNYEKLFGGNG